MTGRTGVSETPVNAFPMDSTSGALRSSKRAFIEQLASRYVYVRNEDHFYCLHSRTSVALKALGSYHAAEAPKALRNGRVLVQRLLEAPQLRKVLNTTYCPGGKLILDQDGGPHLNTWVPPSLTAQPGDYDWFIEHIDYVLDGDPVAIRYLLDFLAFLVQQPGKKINSTPLIIGAQGIGKSMIADVMGVVLGHTNVLFLGNSQLESQFNGWLFGTQLVVVPELQSNGRTELVNKLKPYITDPYLTMNEKYQRTRTIVNAVNFLLFSNYEDAATIELGDRRFMAHVSRAEPRSQDYYALIGQLKNTHAPHILHYLLHRDISEFNPYAPAPTTDSKVRVIEAGHSNLEAYLADAIADETGIYQSDLVRLKEVVEDLRDQRLGSMSFQKVSKMLVALGAKRLDGAKRIHGRFARIWAIRSHEKWMSATPSELEAHLCRRSDTSDST